MVRHAVAYAAVCVTGEDHTIVRDVGARVDIDKGGGLQAIADKECGRRVIKRLCENQMTVGEMYLSAYKGTGSVFVSKGYPMTVLGQLSSPHPNCFFKLPNDSVKVSHPTTECLHIRIGVLVCLQGLMIPSRRSHVLFASKNTAVLHIGFRSTRADHRSPKDRTARAMNRAMKAASGEKRGIEVTDRELLVEGPLFVCTKAEL